MIEPAQIIDKYLYNADHAVNDPKYELRRIVTVEIAEELYKIHKSKMDQI